MKISLDGKKAEYGSYLLPLEITSISKPDFLINPLKNKQYYVVVISPESIPLTVDMLSSNAVEPSEGSLANLLDDNTASYFHTAWSINVPESHYLQVGLNEAIDSFVFDFVGRNSNGNGNPAEIIITGSNDGNTFFPITTILDKDLPTGALASYVSPVIKMNKCKIIRFTVPRNKANSQFFVLSEFKMYKPNR